MNTVEYFTAPIFASVKSSYVVRYQTNLEKRLMECFDADEQIADYFQPLMTVSLIFEDKEINLDIDFWLEYRTGRTVFVHIQNENSFTEQKIMTAFDCSMRLDGFGLLVITKDKLWQPRIRQLRFNFPPPNQYCPKW